MIDLLCNRFPLTLEIISCSLQMHAGDDYIFDYRDQFGKFSLSTTCRLIGKELGYLDKGQTASLAEAPFKVFIRSNELLTPSFAELAKNIDLPNVIGTAELDNPEQQNAFGAKLNVSIKLYLSDVIITALTRILVEQKRVDTQFVLYLPAAHKPKIHHLIYDDINHKTTYIWDAGEKTQRLLVVTGFKAKLVGFDRSHEEEEKNEQRLHQEEVLKQRREEWMRRKSSRRRFNFSPWLKQK